MTTKVALPVTITPGAPNHIPHHNWLHALIGLLSPGEIWDVDSLPRFKSSPWADPEHIDYGALGNGTHDDAAAFAAAMNSAPLVRVGEPSVAFAIKTQITVTTAGDVAGRQIIGLGMKVSLIDNQVANGFVFDFDAGITSDFQFGVEIAHLGVTATTGAAASSFVRFRSQFFLHLHHLDIEDLTGNGFEMKNLDSDPDSTNFPWIHDIYIKNLDGWGFFSEDAGAGNASGSGGFSLDRVYIILCGVFGVSGGGIKFNGLQFVMNGGSISYCQNNGFLVPTPNAGGQIPQHIELSHVEFDTNTVDVAIQACGGGGLFQCKFIGQAVAGFPAGTPVECIILGVDGSASAVQNFQVVMPLVRQTSNTTTLLTIKNNCHSVRLEDTILSTPTTITILVNGGVGTSWRHDGTEQIVEESRAFIVVDASTPTPLPMWFVVNGLANLNPGGEAQKVRYDPGTARTADTHSNTTVDNISPVLTAADVGKGIAGAGIPIGATIVSQTGAGAVISAAATATASGVTVVAYPKLGNPTKTGHPSFPGKARIHVSLHNNTGIALGPLFDSIWRVAADATASLATAKVRCFEVTWDVELGHLRQRTPAVDTST